MVLRFNAACWGITVVLVTAAWLQYSFTQYSHSRHAAMLAAHLSIGATLVIAEVFFYQSLCNFPDFCRTGYSFKQQLIDYLPVTWNLVISTRIFLACSPAWQRAWGITQ